MNIPALLNSLTNRSFCLPIVILYVTNGCNLRCIMCSYRDPLPNELTLDEIRDLARQLKKLGLRHIVYSGGEPLIRRDLASICEIFAPLGVQQSLLTNGLLLDKRFHEIQKYFKEIIVSLDGANAEIHDTIRGVKAFDQIIRGIRTATSARPRPKISIRAVVQKKNFRQLGKMVDLAKSLGVDRISFLAVDVSSHAFHRPNDATVLDQQEILLNAHEALEFRHLMLDFVKQYAHEIKDKFISEGDRKIFHLVQYFEAFAGIAPLPRNHCNAPMVSAVITSTGELLPCFFLPAFGNVRLGSIGETLNDPVIQNIRKQVKEYSLQRCHECVCTLKISATGSLMDRF